MPELVHHYGEPFGDSSALPTWCVARVPRKYDPMVLSGDGGDEMLRDMIPTRYWMMETSPEILHYSFEFSKKYPFWSPDDDAHIFTRTINSVESWEKFITYVQYDERKKMWLYKYHFLSGIPCDLFGKAEINAKDKDRLSFAQHIDKMTYLPCDILTKVDIATMYHGLEVRGTFDKFAGE